jgi:hypothetical protein
MGDFFDEVLCLDEVEDLLNISNSEEEDEEGEETEGDLIEKKPIEAEILISQFLIMILSHNYLSGQHSIFIKLRILSKFIRNAIPFEKLFKFVFCDKLPYTYSLKQEEYFSRSRKNKFKNTFYSKPEFPITTQAEISNLGLFSNFSILTDLEKNRILGNFNKVISKYFWMNNLVLDSLDPLFCSKIIRISTLPIVAYSSMVKDEYKFGYHNEESWSDKITKIHIIDYPMSPNFMLSKYHYIYALAEAFQTSIIIKSSKVEEAEADYYLFQYREEDEYPKSWQYEGSVSERKWVEVSNLSSSLNDYKKNFFLLDPKIDCYPGVWNAYNQKFKSFKLQYFYFSQPEIWDTREYEYHSFSTFFADLIIQGSSEDCYYRNYFQFVQSFKILAGLVLDSKDIKMVKTTIDAKKCKFMSSFNTEDFSYLKASFSKMLYYSENIKSEIFKDGFRRFISDSKKYWVLPTKDHLNFSLRANLYNIDYCHLYLKLFLPHSLSDLEKLSSKCIVLKLSLQDVKFNESFNIIFDSDALVSNLGFEYDEYLFHQLHYSLYQVICRNIKLFLIDMIAINFKISKESKLESLFDKLAGIEDFDSRFWIIISKVQRDLANNYDSLIIFQNFGNVFHSKLEESMFVFFGSSSCHKNTEGLNTSGTENFNIVGEFLSFRANNWSEFACLHWMAGLCRQNTFTVKDAENKEIAALNHKKINLMKPVYSKLANQSKTKKGYSITKAPF